MAAYGSHSSAYQQSAQGAVKGPSPPEGFDVIHCIGEGTYGRVFLAKTKTGKCVAIKTLKAVKEGEGISLTAVREAMLLKELHHVNILHLESVHLNRADASLSLAFEFADYDLYEMIIHHRTNLKNAKPHVQHFPAVMVKSIMWQLLNGLSYLHQNWIIHRDLKPSNLLLMGQGESLGQLKIADFGLARVFRSPSRPLSDNGVVVTIWYRAPELLLGAKHYTGAVDLWAAACIFGELLTLKPLFHGQEVRTPLDAFQRNQLDQIFSILGHPNVRQWPDIVHMPHWNADTQSIRTPLPDHKYQLEAHLMKLNPTLATDPGRNAAFDLMKRLLEFDPRKRITAAEALQHEYFSSAPRPSMNAFPASLKVKYAGKMAEEIAPKPRPQTGVAQKRVLPQKRAASTVSGRVNGAAATKR